MNTAHGSAQGGRDADAVRARAIGQLIGIAGVVFGLIGTVLAVLIATGR